jgi:hypothetical protein
MLRMSDQKTWCAVIVGGLLSSNCCALQLLLNYMGVGCAGFAILAPFRLLFLAASAALLVFTTPSTLVIARSLQAVIFCSLVLMPEIIGLYSRNGNPILLFSSDYHSSYLSLLLRVTGMKCAACGERARSLSLSAPCVRGSTVHWERGFMKLQITAGSDTSKCGQMVSATLQQAGFDTLFHELCNDASLFLSRIASHPHLNSNCSMIT